MMILGILLFGCSPKNTAVIESAPAKEIKSSDEDDEMGELQAASNSKVLAQLVSKSKMDGVSVESPCHATECIGSFEIKAFIQYGANFHGQLEEGQVVQAEFEFTLSETSGAFPELNHPLPGLSVGDYFEAELFENVDNGSFTIRLYELKK